MYVGLSLNISSIFCKNIEFFSCHKNLFFSCVKIYFYSANKTQNIVFGSQITRFMLKYNCCCLHNSYSMKCIPCRFVHFLFSQVLQASSISQYRKLQACYKCALKKMHITIRHMLLLQYD